MSHFSMDNRTALRMEVVNGLAMVWSTGVREEETDEGFKGPTLRVDAAVDNKRWFCEAGMEKLTVESDLDDPKFDDRYMMPMRQALLRQYVEYQALEAPAL